MPANKLAKEFYHFLDVNNIREEFFREVRKNSVNLVSVENFIESTAPKDLMPLSFDWTATQKGFNYWHDISFKWINVVASIDRKFLKATNESAVV